MNLRADNKGLRTSLRTNAKTVLGQKKTIGDLEREMESERKDRETKKRSWKEERGNLTPRKRQRLEAPAQETAPAPEDPAYAGVFEDDNLIDIDQEYELPVPAPRPVPAAPPPIASVAAASPLPVPAADPAAAPAPVGLVPPFPPRPRASASGHSPRSDLESPWRGLPSCRRQWDSDPSNFVRPPRLNRGENITLGGL